MGSDKRVAVLGGETLLHRAVRRMAEAGLAVTVIGGPPDVPAPASHLPDRTPGAGPMDGAFTALTALPAPVAIVGVDMPDVSATLLRALAAREPTVAASPLHDGVVQPLHSVWGPQGWKALSAAWDDGDRSLRWFLENTAGVELMSEEDAADLAGAQEWWTSLDTPADLGRRQSD